MAALTTEMNNQFFFMRVIFVLLLMLLPGWIVTALADNNAASYRLGSGYPIADTGWRLGGYASLEGDVLQSGHWKAGANDLSLFIMWDNGSRLRFFSELEAGDLVRAEKNQAFGARAAHFEFERFYLDTFATDTLTIRTGKFLTPIGRWNQIHAAPLVWTSNRPVVTKNLFSAHATGIMLYGALPLGERSLEYSVYGDLSESLDPHLSPNPFNHAIGGRLRYDLSDTLQVGASFASFVLRDGIGKRNHLAGLDMFWSHRRHEISSEIVYRTGGQAPENPHWQGFIQGVSPISRHWYLVGRYEFFQQSRDKTGQVGLLGIAYRPRPPLIWKLEYRLGTHNDVLAPDGLSASFSVLF